MKKGGEKKVNISNKLSYTIIVVLVIMLFGVSVYAYGTIAPATFGHSIGELEPPSECPAGRFLSWGGSSWICTQPSVSDISDPSRLVRDVENVSRHHAPDGCYGGKTVQCPANTKVIGGGCSVGTEDSTVEGNVIEKSYPLYGSAGDGWYCRTINVPGIYVCTVYALCAKYD